MIKTIQAYRKRGDKGEGEKLFLWGNYEGKG